MAGALVQSWEQSETTNVTSTTVTVSGATANNLLIAVIAGRAGMDTEPTASGWTKISGFSTGNDWGSGFFYRVATGDSNDNFATDTWTDPGKAYTVVAEYSGLASTSPLETSNEDETNIAGSVTSQGTGSATPSTANGTAIAAHTADQNSIWNDPPGKTSVNNSFTTDKENDTDDGSIPYAAISSLNYTSATAKSCTMSTTDSGGHAYGAIANFKDAAAGGSETTTTFTEASIQYVGQSIGSTTTANITTSITPASLQYAGESITSTVASDVVTTITEASIQYVGQEITSTATSSGTAVTTTFTPASVQYIGQIITSDVTANVVTTFENASIRYIGATITSNASGQSVPEDFGFLPSLRKGKRQKRAHRNARYRYLKASNGE